MLLPASVRAMPASSLELAQQRLKRLMRARRLDLDGVAKLLGMIPDRLQSVLDGTAMGRMYAEGVVAEATRLLEQGKTPRAGKQEARMLNESGKQESVAAHKDSAAGTDSGEGKNADGGKSVIADAMASLDVWLKESGLSISKAAEKLGFYSNYLHNCRSQYRNGMMTEATADKIMKAIEATKPPAPATVPADGERLPSAQEASPADNDLQALGEELQAMADADEAEFGDAAQEVDPSLPYPGWTDPEGVSRGNKEVAIAITHDMAVLEAAQDLICDALGCNLAELTANKAAVDRLLGAKRLGLKVQIQITGGVFSA